MALRPSALVLACATLLLAALGVGLLAGTPTDAADAPTVRAFDLEAVERTFEVYPGKNVTMWTYGGQVPGPLIRATEGDLVRVRFWNNHSLPHTVHFHGDHPYEMDGADHQAVPPGGSFTYEFVAGPAGAYVYHCHVDTPVHIPMGLYGQFVVDPRGGWGGPEPDREAFAVFSDWNPHHNATAETYLLNGRAFPSTEAFRADVGERVRLFVSSMSDFPVAAHLHGTLPQQVWPARHPIDVVPLAHAETRVVDFVASQPGAWMFHDHYEQHLKNDGVYPGGSMGAFEVGEAWWGRFHETMGHGAHGHGDPPAAPADAPDDATPVAVRDYDYGAAELTVPAGTTVVWTNEGRQPHTVTSDDEGGPLDSPLLKPGERYAFTFAEPGTYLYHCHPHSGKGKDGTWKGMVAKVVVTPA